MSRRESLLRAKRHTSTVYAQCARSTLSAFCGYVRERLAREGLAEHDLKKKRVSSFPFKTVCNLLYGQPRRSTFSMNVPAVGRAPVQPSSATCRGCAVPPITMGDGRTRASIQDARGPRPGSGLGASVARPRAPRAAPHRRRESALSSNACRAARHLATLPRFTRQVIAFSETRARKSACRREKARQKSLIAYVFS